MQATSIAPTAPAPAAGADAGQIPTAAASGDSPFADVLTEACGGGSEEEPAEGGDHEGATDVPVALALPWAAPVLVVPPANEGEEGEPVDETPVRVPGWAPPLSASDCGLPHTTAGDADATIEQNS